MEKRIWDSREFRLLLAAGAVFLFLKFLVPVLAPGLCAMLFVTIFGPLMQKLQKKCRLPRRVTALLLLLLLGMAVGGLIWLLLTLAIDGMDSFASGLPILEEKMGNLVQLRQFSEKLLPEVMAKSPAYFGKLLKVGGFLICFLIATLLLAGDYDDIMNRLLEKESCEKVLTVVCGVIRYVATYVKAQAVILTIIGVLCGGVLTVMRIPNGCLWGILAGILDAMPFIGTGVVLVPLAISRFLAGKYAGAAGCLILYVVCIFVREILEPKLIGRRMGVAPVIILLSIYAGMKLFGPVGILEGPLGYVILAETGKVLEKTD